MNIALLALLLPAAVAAQGRTAFLGEWRGQAQYQATVGGALDSAAHTVTNLTIAVEADGRIRGTSTENGCRLLGLASPHPMATILSLDITLSGCQYAGLNRRLSGTLALYPKDKYVALQLQGFQTGLAKTPAYFDIKATLRR